MITSIENKVVLIYKNELRFIRSFNLDYMSEKILFTLLTINKLNNYEGIYNTDNKKGIYFELAAICNVNLRTYEKRREIISSALNSLSDLGLIKVQSDLCIELLFLPNENISYENLKYEEKITIKIFDKIGYYYDNYYKKNRIKFCECCESPIQSGSNRSKYCSNCSKMINKLRKKDYMKEIRNKDVILSE